MTDHYIGPYRIVRRLGEGGMGAVDLAHHVETGQIVALKQVKQISGPFLEALAREVSALAEIRHPNIVRIFDHDLSCETPWYAMEFVRGPSLRERLENKTQHTNVFDSEETKLLAETLALGALPTLATPPDSVHGGTRGSTSATRLAHSTRGPCLELLRPMTDVCAALSALHEAGIIHRDLKPENILFRETGEAVVVDFGISMLALGAQGRERLTRTLRGSGTPMYMAPEQALSRPLDARADLYSLGIILFEIATGAAPFNNPSLIRILNDHVYTTPPPARDLNPRVPVDIDALIAQLLSKRPSDRLGFAFDVDLALRRAFGMEPPAYEPPTYVYAPEFVGRDNALKVLSDFARRVKRRGQGSLLICGDAGIGKTRLILEFIQSVGQDIAIYIGTGKQDSNTPFRAFFSVWLSFLEQDPKAAERVKEDFGAWWHQILSGQRAVDRNDIALALTLLTTLSNETQRLVILDDAHWLDPWSEILLEHLVQNPPQGFGIIILARQKNIESQNTQKLTLEPLNREQTIEMMKSMIGRDAVAQAHVDFAFRESSGNPFILAEMARVAMRERMLFRDQVGVWGFASEKAFQTADIPASEKIVATFKEYVSFLAPHLRDSLNWCACIGGSTDPRLLRKVAPDVNPQTLIESSIMYWDGLRLRFKQNMLSRVLYDHMDADERSQKHLKIALTLQKLTETNPFVLGRHFFRAGALESAQPYLWKAYEQAVRLGLMKDALKYFDFWVRSHTVHDASFWRQTVDVLETDLWRSSALYANTCRYLLEAGKDVENLEVQTILHAQYVLGICDETPEIKAEWIERTLALSEKSNSPKAKLMALKAARMALDFDRGKVMALLKEILEIAPRVSTQEHVNALIDYGRTLQNATRYDEARKVLNQARLVSEHWDVLPRIRYALISSIALLEGECGNPELSLKLYREISDDLKRHVTDHDIAFYHCGVAQQLIALKRYDEAQLETECAETIAGYMPYHQVRAMAVLHQANIAELKGDIAGAHLMFGRGETIYSHPKLQGFRFHAFWKHGRARFLRRIGDFEGALKHQPRLGIEPYLDACILSEQGFVALHHDRSVDDIIARLEKLTVDMSFGKTSVPGQLLAALKLSAAAKPDERIHGEHRVEFPPDLLAAINRA